MDAFIDLVQENPAAVGFGAIGLFCQLIWPLFRARRAMMTAQLGIGVDYSLHYALMDAWSGAGVAALGATQTALNLIAGDRAWLKRAGVVFLPVVTVICVATWCGPASLCALAAVSLVMIGRMQSDTLRLRILLLAAAPFGMGYDILIGSIPGLIGAVFSACVAVTMLVREVRERRGESLRLQFQLS
ncbi:MAG: YgjV family protein [Hyphomicrobiales bacterium]|nr:YgjV family protein [Hyphomicrobiales bacterium]